MFNRCFYVNLDRRPDRRERFEAQIAAMPDWPFPPPERVPAVDQDPPGWHQAGKGAWGCFRSHMNIYHYAMTHALRSVLIFEDDAVFCEDFCARARAFVEAVPDDWDMIYLGGNHYLRLPISSQGMGTLLGPLLPEPVNDLVLCPHIVNTTHAYALNRNAIRCVYEILARFPEAMMDDDFHMDTLLGSLHELRAVKAYCPWEWLVGQGAGLSDISHFDHEGEPWWFQLPPEVLEYLRKGVLV